MRGPRSAFSTRSARVRALGAGLRPRRTPDRRSPPRAVTTLTRVFFTFNFSLLTSWCPMPLPTATELLRLLQLEPDPWQIQVLEGNHPRLLLNCCRQAGKSTVVAFLSLVEALYNPGTLVLLLSRSLRQSTELFRLVAEFNRRLGQRFLEGQSRHELRFTHGSRIVSLPCQPDTVRGFSKVHILVIDEAARVPDELYRSVRPMLAVSRGRLICLSTPHGRRGFFYEAWANGGDDWTRIEVPASQIPRITPEFLAEERRHLGSDSYYRQEYECSFEALEGLVYPDFARCLVPLAPSPLSPNSVRRAYCVRAVRGEELCGGAC